ncbi:hypothetical protein PENTCL1PPCAC_15308, partial [Pristionchus entomophagus]
LAHVREADHTRPGAPGQIRLGRVHVGAVSDRCITRLIHVPIRVWVGRLILPSPNAAIRLLVSDPVVIGLGRRLGKLMSHESSLCVVVDRSDKSTVGRARRLRLVEGNARASGMIAPA